MEPRMKVFMSRYCHDCGDKLYRTPQTKISKRFLPRQCGKKMQRKLIMIFQCYHAASLTYACTTTSTINPELLGQSFRIEFCLLDSASGLLEISFARSGRCAIQDCRTASALGFTAIRCEVWSIFFTTAMTTDRPRKRVSQERVKL